MPRSSSELARTVTVTNPPETRDPHGNLVIDGTIRYARFEDGVKLAVIDIVKAVTSNNAEYSALVISSLSEKVITDVFYQCGIFRFKGPDQKDSTLVTVEAAYKLIMALPGENATSMRLKLINSLLAKIKELGQEKSLGTILTEKLDEHVQGVKSKPPATEYIYAMVSKAFPGLIKIGRAADITKRMRSLNAAVAPKPFGLVAATPTLNSERDEKRVHDFFKDRHEAADFFRVSAGEVAKFFNTEIYVTYSEEVQLCAYDSDSDSDSSAKKRKYE